MRKLFLFSLFCVSIKTIYSSIDMSVSVTNGQTVDVKWKAPTEVNIIGYNLTVFPFLQQNPINVNIIKISANNSLSVKVGGLTPGAKYSLKLKLIAINKTIELISEKSFTTKPNPPKNSLFCYVSVQSIHVMWDDPQQPTIYDTFLASIEPRDSPSSTKFINKEKNGVVFEGLTPGRAYNLSVQTRSNDQFSDQLRRECRTIPISPSHVWYDPNTLSPHSFDIHWGPPNKVSEFDSYFVIKDDILYKILRKDENRLVNFSEELKPGKTYRIEVSTRSGQVSSKPVQCNVTTRPLPLLTLKSSPGNKSDILVEWTVSDESTQDSFLVTFWEINEYVLKESIRVINMTSIHLYNLLAGRNYSIAVVAVSNNISSQPTIVYQSTRPPPPQIDKIVQTSDEIVNISWKHIKTNQSYYKIVFTRLDTNESKALIIKDYWALLVVYPGAKYEINLSEMSRGLRSLPSSLTYLTAPRAPTNLSITNLNTSSVSLTWIPPNDSLIDSYIVRYRIYTNNEWQELISISNNSIELNDLKISQKYLIRVTSVSNGIESSNKIDFELRFEPNVMTTSKEFIDTEVDINLKEKKSQKSLVVAILIVILIIVMIVTIVGPGLYIYYKRSNTIPKEDVTEDELEEEPLNSRQNEQVEIDETLVIDRKDLQVSDKIGQGQFGSVHSGYLTVRSGRLAIAVAIKMSNVLQNERDMEEFLKEALIMKNFSHQNVLSLIGVSFENEGSPLVVLPFMKNGDVLSWIRNEINEPTVKQLITFAIDVAKGMEYLSNQHFIHRDLAARNCMLDNDLSVKVADFGLSKHIITKDYYKNENSMQLMPIKWMSIESLEKGIYDTKTDVWSYGVLVWELMTRGVIPYPNLQHFEVLPHLRNGYRLPQPNYCPDLIYDILQECWNRNPKMRPTFKAIVIRLVQVIDALESVSFCEQVDIENITYYNQPVTYSTTVL